MHERKQMIGRWTVLAAGLVAFACHPPRPETGDLVPVSIDSLPLGSAKFDSTRGELTMELLPIDIPAAHGHDGMVVTPATRVMVPATGFINSIRTEMYDGNGTLLPTGRLHHVNVIDPQRRELFAPIALRLYAASKEAEEVGAPKLLFGMPLLAGQPVLLKAMLHNPDTTVVRGARVRVVFGFTRGGAMWPWHQAFPMQLDVLFPVGQVDGIKSFDLPPGHFEMKYSAKPAISGKLVGMAGHFHDYGQFIEFKDVTDNKVVFRGEPVLDSSGAVRSIPPSMFYKWYSSGPQLSADHTYEVRVVYHNPTADTIRFGGMGIVGGIIVPNRGERWPAVDTTDVSYRMDLMYQLRDGNSVGEMAMMHDHAASVKPAATVKAAAPAHKHQ